MNTPIEQRTTALPRGFALLSKLQSMICVRYKEWRAQQLARAELEALEALGPDVLDDIGITIVRTNIGPRPIAMCNPHHIALSALTVGATGKPRRPRD